MTAKKAKRRCGQCQNRHSLSCVISSQPDRHILRKPYGPFGAGLHISVIETGRMYVKNETIDFYTANNDFSGERVVEKDHEIVQHQGSCAIRIWRNVQIEPFDTHWHTDLEIIVPVENWYDVMVEGKAYHLMPDDILIIPSGALHSLTAPDSGTRFIYLFDISSIASIHGFSELSTLLASPLHITKAAFPHVYNDTYQTLMQICTEYFSKSPLYELSVFSLLMNLFVMLGKNQLNSMNAFSNASSYKQQEYISKFNSVMEYIDEHFTEDFRLEDAAAATGFSKYYFSRLFKQYTGYTFCSYLMHLRIKAAEQLLEQPGLSIAEIAMRSGFPSIPTFNRVFRQQKHCSPTEYREKNNKLNPLSHRRG